MSGLYLVPAGLPRAGLIAGLAGRLRRVFATEVEVTRLPLDLQACHDPVRNQYRTTPLLRQLLDAPLEGRVLAVLDGEPVAYVLLGGPDPIDLDPGDFAPRGYAVASELAKNLTSSVRGRVTVIEVTADGSQLTLVLDDGATRVRFGEARDLFAKLVRLETILSTRDELPTGTIDVSTRLVRLPDDGGGAAAEGGSG